jgi:ABC-2 type transporter
VAARNFWVNGTRAAASIVLGVAFGTVNWRLGVGQRSIQRRAALLMQCAINSAFLSLVQTLHAFPRERTVVRHEMARGRGRGGYSSLPYFISKLLVEAPLDAMFPLLFGQIAAQCAGLSGGSPGSRARLLGTLALQGLSASALGLSISALSPTTESALALGPCAMVLSIMLGDSSGVFASIPAGLRWLSDFSIIKWGFHGALCSEFEGLRFSDEDADSLLPPEALPPARAGRAGAAAAAAARSAAAALCVRDGEAVLRRMGLPQRGGFAECAKAQLRAAASLLSLALVALQLRDGGGGSSLAWDPLLRAPSVKEDEAARLKHPNPQ